MAESDLVERLRAHGDKFPIKNSAEWIDFASLYLVEAAARIERLEALLRPFAEAANGFDSYNIKNPEEWFCYGGVQGSGETTGAITVGDLRRARAALGEKP